MLHLTQADYSVTRWSGGTATQIAIVPPGASYQDRDFLWRVSSAEACALARGESLLLEEAGDLRLTVPEAADFVLAEIFR